MFKYFMKAITVSLRNCQEDSEEKCKDRLVEQMWSKQRVVVK
jgi:hypothetical protein